MPIYQYTIPLIQDGEVWEPAYEHPEENEINKYEKGGKLIVIQDKVIPHFHKDSIPVSVDVLVADEAELEPECR